MQFFNQLRTPAAQARIRVYEHIALIGVIQAVLCSAAFLDGNTSTNWQTVAVVAIGQGVLAALDALYTYFKASGNVQGASIVAGGRAEAAQLAAQRLPSAPKLNANLQAIGAAADVALQPTAEQVAVAAPVQIAAPAKVDAAAYPTLDGFTLQNSLPNLPVVNIPPAQ